MIITIVTYSTWRFFKFPISEGIAPVNWFQERSNLVTDVPEQLTPIDARQQLVVLVADAPVKGSFINSRTLQTQQHWGEEAVQVIAWAVETNAVKAINSLTFEFDSVDIILFNIFKECPNVLLTCLRNPPPPSRLEWVTEWIRGMHVGLIKCKVKFFYQSNFNTLSLHEFFVK